MAKFNIPDPDEADVIMDLVVNAADRARISGLEFAAELAEDIAASQEDRVALLAFKFGDERSGGSGAELAKAARTSAAIHRRRAKALKAEAEATKLSLDGAIEPTKAPKRPKGAERVEVEIAVSGAGDVAKGAHVTLMACGRDIASAEVDDRGIARFALDPEKIVAPPERGFRVAGFRGVGQPEIPAEPLLHAEIRSESGRVLRRALLQPDLGHGKAKKFTIELDGEESVKGKKQGT